MKDETKRKLSVYFVIYRKQALVYLTLIMIAVNSFASFQLISGSMLESVFYVANLIIGIAYYRRVRKVSVKDDKPVKKLKIEDVHKTALE